MEATDYLLHIRALIMANPHVTDWVIVREAVEGISGMYRYRLGLSDGGLLEIFELFQMATKEIKISKYSFHWQDSAGKLRKRWDNAAHHSEIASHPHHLHDGDENRVLSSQPMTTEVVLKIISEHLQG